MTQQEDQVRLERYRVLGQSARLLMLIWAGYNVWLLYGFLKTQRPGPLDTWMHLAWALVTCLGAMLIYIFIDSRKLPPKLRRDVRSSLFKVSFRRVRK